MGTVKDRNSRDLVKAEEIKKTWEGWTEELYEKDLNELDNHGGMVRHQEEAFCSVKSSGP